MFYIVLLLILSIFSIRELGNKIPYREKAFDIFCVLMTLILCFRYGQGTDYFGYYYSYITADFSWGLFENTLSHGELGWYMLMYIADKIGLNFEAFVAVISVVMMFSTRRAIKLYSPYGITSLLLMYPACYLTYYFSGLRQGLVISLFLGFGLDLLISKKYLRYYILSVILVSFHTASVLLFLMPVLLRFKEIQLEKYVLVIIGFGVVISYFNIPGKLGALIGRPDYLPDTFSVGAFLLRGILLYIIYRFHRSNVVVQLEQFGKKDEIEHTLYYLYVLGSIFYFLFPFYALVSQRMTIPLKAIEVILIPLLLGNMDKYREIIKVIPNIYIPRKLRVAGFALLVVLIANVEAVKNINSYITQGDYYSWVNVINYPYITIFDKDSVSKYRFVRSVLLRD